MHGNFIYGLLFVGKTGEMTLNEPLSVIEQWRQEEVVLGEIGKEFSGQATLINVRIAVRTSWPEGRSET